jgi:RNA polymerase sigma-70 factor, ECF subfamily
MQALMGAPDGAGWVDEALRAWPRVILDRESFRAEVERRAASLGLSPGDLHTSDLYLAQACARGDENAIAAFERELISSLPQALSRTNASAAAIDEVCQQVRLRVLVGDREAPPRIMEYSGRGSLASWLRVVALRLHADLHRGSGKHRASVECEDEPAVAERTPELALALHRYGPAIEQAIRIALSELEPRDRTIMRLVYVDGQSLERIGALYGVHKATVSRWLSAARASVLERSARGARLALGLSDTREAGSLIESLQSGLDLSLSGLLRIDA